MARGRYRWADAARPSSDAVAEGWTAAAQLTGARRLLADLPPSAGDAARSGDSAGAAETTSPLRVRMIGHDMKFMRELASVLDGWPDLDVEVDEWRRCGSKERRHHREPRPVRADAGRRMGSAKRGLAVGGEAARPTADRPPAPLRDRQRVSRSKIDINAVNAVVYIAPHMGRRIRDEIGWPVEKLVYVPNYADLAAARPAEVPGRTVHPRHGADRPARSNDSTSRSTCSAPYAGRIHGSVCWYAARWVGRTSRPGRARRNAAKSSGAWNAWRRTRCLRGAVVFDAFGRDMAAWYRKVGHILSLSDVEGSHASLCEGMGSGAVPVIRGWQGAAEAYGKDALCGSLDNAVARLLEDADQATWEGRSAAAKREVATRFDPGQVVRAWVDLSYGRIDQARQRFADYADPAVLP